MGTLARRGDSWRAQIARKGIRESATFPTRQQAVDWIVAREAEILAGKVVAGRQTLAAVIERWETGRKVSKSDQVRLRAFERLSWASEPVAKLTAETLSTWRDARLAEVSPGTVIREMTTLRTLLEYARRDLGWLAVNPLADVRRPPEPPARKRLIGQAEIDALIAKLGYTGQVETIEHEIAVALLLALETGMRAGELLGLRPADVRGAVAYLPKTKNGDSREVPLSRRARELVEALRAKKLVRIRTRSDGRLFHITPAVLDAAFRRARDRAGLSGFTFHDSRANALTRLAQVLAPLDLARMIGHRDLGSLLIYYRPSAASIAERLG